MNNNDGGDGKSRVIETMEELLTHALTMETEAAEQFEEIASSLEHHNNTETAALFSKLAGFGREHAAEVQAAAEGTVLPMLKPWEFKWPDGISPEAAPQEDTHYLMNGYQALALARRVETQAQKFYQSVAETSPDAQVRELAAEFAAEEAEHVALLDEWIKDYPEPEKDWDVDDDPAVISD